MPRTAGRWLLLLHPRQWRERYGAEVRDLSDELCEAGASSRLRISLGLLMSALREWSRVVLHRPGRVFVAMALVAVAVVGSLTLVNRFSGTAPQQQSAPTIGGPISIKDGKVKAPDFIPVEGKGKIAGYEPRSFLFPSDPNEPQTSEVGPVYARDLHTLVGHEYPGVGFVPLGVSPLSLPCMKASTEGLAADGQWVTTPIACPSTLEEIPSIVGEPTPTAMGQLSGDSLTTNIRYVHSSLVAGGHIVSITPGPGTKVPARSVLTVVSSLGPG